MHARASASFWTTDRPSLPHQKERLFQYMEYRDPALVGQTLPNASQLMKKLSNEALQVKNRIDPAATTTRPLAGRLFFTSLHTAHPPWRPSFCHHHSTHSCLPGTNTSTVAAGNTTTTTTGAAPRVQLLDRDLQQRPRHRRPLPRWVPALRPAHLPLWLTRPCRLNKPSARLRLLLHATGELCTRCRGLIVKGEVSDTQRPQLIEMLVVVANALPDPQQRMAFIQELVADSEAYWENPSTTQVSERVVPAAMQCTPRPLHNE